MSRRAMTILAATWLLACGSATDVPPGGWANTAPTVVTQVIDRDAAQLLEVRQGDLSAWVQVPDVGARVGDYVLLGQGAARRNVEVPELRRPVPAVVDIEHIRVVDESTAREVVAQRVPPTAVGIGTIYAELSERAGDEVVVYGTVVKSTSAVGAVWVHVQDGTGDAAAGTHDLTIKTSQPAAVGHRVAYRGTLRADVDLGFGYHYDALVEDGVRVQ